MFKCLSELLTSFKVWLEYFLILILLIIFKYFYTAYISIVFIFILLLLPFISIIYVIIGLCTIKISVKFEPKVCIKNNTIILNLILSNKSFICYPTIRIKYSIPALNNKSSQIKVLKIKVHSKQNIVIKHEIFCKYRGLYQGVLYYIEVNDLFGFFRLKLRFKNTIKFEVFPRKLELFEDLPTEINNSLNYNYIDISNIIGTRKYILGDELKLIHWKNTAKLDDIVVKEFQAEIESNNLIFIDLNNYYQGEKSFEAIDGVVETSISLVSKLISNNININVLWYDNQINYKNLMSYLDFDEFFNNIALTTFNNKNIEIEHLIFNQIDYNSVFILSSAINYKLISKLDTWLDNTKINYIYFEVEDTEIDFNLLNYYNINFWYIKDYKIIMGV